MNKQSEENVKKKLRKMLYGYKKNDHKVLIDSLNQKPQYEDTLSVSSFSEFEANGSSNELESEGVSGTEDTASKSKSDEEAVDQTLDSLSEYEDHNDTISDDLSCGVETDLSIRLANDDMSSDASSSSLSGIESEPETFDPDGALANEILKKLAKKTQCKTKKTKKRKEISDDLSLNVERMKKVRITETCLARSESPASLYDGLSLDESETEDPANFKLPTPKSDEDSQPFVTVEAKDMITKKLGEIMDGYQHSTIKNLPSEMPTLIAKTTDIFHSDYINYDEESSSIISEVENQNIIEDDNLAENFEKNSDDNLEFIDESDPNLELNLEADLSHQEFDQSQEELNQQTNSMEEDQNELPHSGEAEDTIETSFLNAVKVYNLKNCCIFTMKHPASIYFHGKIKITPLGGKVEVFGNVLDAPREVYAPLSNMAHYIKTVESDGSFYGLFGELTGQGMSVEDAEEIVTTISNHDAVIKMQSFKDLKIDFVQNNFDITNLFSKQSKSVENCFRKSCEFLGCSLYLTRPYKSFEEHTDWEQLFKFGYNKYSRGIICGGKNTGKSTFLRYYVNKLVSQGPVLVLDLDPAQCEFTVAGNISATIVKDPLLGPNYTHLKTPNRMLHIGMINVMDSLSRYVNAVTELVDHCYTDEQYRNMPWIVNTMGMCNPTGLKLITAIILKVRPTFLLQMDAANPKRKFEFYLNPMLVKSKYFSKFSYDKLFRNISCSEHLDYRFLVSQQYTEVIGKGHNFSMAPRDERYLNFLAYFGELAEQHPDVDFLGIVPYEVSLDSVAVVSNVKFAEEGTHKVINGKIIALCQHDSLADKAGKMFTLGDKPMLCHGYGIVRGVDSVRRRAYVLSPAAGLRRVEALAYCDWAPELRGPERLLPRGVALPYRTAAPHQQRALIATPRRRFNPLQLVKMSRNT